MSTSCKGIVVLKKPGFLLPCWPVFFSMADKPDWDGLLDWSSDNVGDAYTQELELMTIAVSNIHKKFIGCSLVYIRQH